MYIDTEAERRVLSAMMHSETACIEAIDSLDEAVFSDELNRNVFVLIKDLYLRGVKPTFVEVIKEGVRLGFIASVRDNERVKEIANAHIKETNVFFWIEKVKEARSGREAQRLLRKHVAGMKDGKEIKKLIEDISSDFYNLAMGTDDEYIEDPGEVADLGIELLEERTKKYREMQEDVRLQGLVPLEGVPTGIPTLDRMTLGMKPGDLVILGAQTGHGKTALALNIARAACVDSDKNVLYVNTEMSREQIARRWGAILSDVELSQIQAGSVTNEQKEAVKRGYERLRNSGFYPCAVPNLTPEKLDVLARKAKMQKDIDLLILDYVGRMEKIKPDLAEWQVLEQIIKTQKILAQTLNIACLVLVQLNFDGTLQGAKRMENESDLMLKMLPADDPDSRRCLEEARGMQFEEFNYRIYISKARDAQSGLSIPLKFDKARQHIEEAREIKSQWEDLGEVVGRR